MDRRGIRAAPRSLSHPLRTVATYSRKGGPVVGADEIATVDGVDDLAPAESGATDTPPEGDAGKGSDGAAAALGVADRNSGVTRPAQADVPEEKQPAPPARERSRANATKKPRKKGTPKKRSGASIGQQARFPRHPVEKALRIPKAIYDQNAGKPSTLAEAAKFTTGGAASGEFRVEVSSAKKYGFLKSDAGKLLPQDRARKAIAPQSESDRLVALREAVLEAPDLADVYAHYRGENLPDDQFFRNALVDRFQIPADKVAEFLDVFYESMRSAQLIDDSGERKKLIDVGREDGVATARPAAVPRVHVAEGTTCFVMQPFGGHLGTYYDLIFKPAIRQAGLTPVRADDDIFATGKIMDQVWRGIRQATVLVAELTSKNPNVFYELGLAHALEKPVILVSSNQEDVPFDLRHIRVVLYDQADPFWGQKLIDKIADNIKSALTNPEEAIFRADGDG